MEEREACWKVGCERAAYDSTVEDEILTEVRFCLFLFIFCAISRVVPLTSRPSLVAQCAVSRFIG